MKTLVCFLEEKSACEMLKGVLPRVLPKDMNVQFIVFEGKQDLDRQLARKLRGWQIPESVFLVVRDQDAADCKVVKNRLVKICRSVNNNSQILTRIACHELESFYFGDLTSVEKALHVTLSSFKRRAKYRIPDNIISPSRELEKITNGVYQKIGGSRAIGKIISLDENLSHSFQMLISGIKKLCECEDRTNN
jgi:hypothetical protein